MGKILWHVDKTDYQNDLPHKCQLPPYFYDGSTTIDGRDYYPGTIWECDCGKRYILTFSKFRKFLKSRSKWKRYKRTTIIGPR